MKTKKPTPKTTKRIQSPLRMGASVLIRTVTHYYTGRIVLLTREEVVLADAAWVADTGRYHVALRDGTLVEVEPYPESVSIARGAIVDVTTWAHPLPRAAL